MADLAKLLEQRAQTWNKMQAIIDLPERTADDNVAYDRMETEVDTLTEEIGRVERHQAKAKAFDSVDRSGVVPPQNGAARKDDTDPAERYDNAFGAYLRGGMMNLRGDDRDVLENVGGDLSGFRNALSVGTNSAGGYLVPPGWRDEFIIQMKDYGAVQAVAQVIRTDAGQSIQWPTMNDTTNVGRLLSENTQMTETDVVVGTATLAPYMYSSDLTRVSYQLANDSAFDIGALVRAAHAERIGRITNQHFTTGTGTSQPQGIVTGATSGVTAAAVAAITADELIDLVHSVDPAYRRSPRVQFMLSDTALKSLRKLKDSNGMYLWQPNVQAGEASNLFGYPYVINQDMAVPAAAVKSVLFGDFQAGYVVRIVQDLMTMTLTERYADFLQVGHSSFMRAGGVVQNASAYKALTQAAA